jgi:choline dehydrogenase
MSKYNVIVVGAGASGAPLAARLSEDPERTVLLIEAGPDYAKTEDFPKDLLNAGIMTGAMPGHPNNWGFVANLTPELPYSVSRGKIMGGSTTLNGTYYIRAKKADFDRWVEMGNPEWSYEKVLPFFKKQEKDLLFGEADIHGGEGPLPIFREIENIHPITKAFNAACKELGFAEEPDKNAEGDPGIGPLPMNALNGVRINTGIAYINPNRNRPNLTIRGNTLARKIIFKGTKATGLEVETNRKIEIIEADEIVLSAGAVKSPHLLMLSGIGPRKELEMAGIAVIADLPGVGKNFSDHPDIPFTWRPKKRFDIPGYRDSFQVVLNFSAKDSPYHEGDLEILPQLKTLAEAMGMDTGNRISGLWDIISRPLQTLKALKGISLRRFFKQVAHQNDLMFAIAVQQAESRGNITISSKDPHIQPKIDYNYLSNASDLKRMREVVHTSVSILKSNAFSDIFKDLGELSEKILNDDKLLNDWMKKHLATAIHACGSCKMGPEDDKNAVVNQYGKVYGVTGVRVCDTSIFPLAPSRGPAATAIMAGDRIADFIKSSK